ncbi:MAG: bifunctional diaminohydroxyphosphoribosylaminopyrimidine deaminase/5-amino-6-(5-phosphoribosylamino)uracil reductase RibD [Acidobacteria bacterium]|jgi:diaminohydroxyphosphoribosylaminopyrimidine deaminase/5-amino-6-(5-phosphoribosylamino)uracil reductase|nr:bifunctional diaminohydroxyphosphoribosylaminopyrimidine deaminase/5-amino-6-(5-phosphoribosylamino)uracil reductase RibD [Acidobacteriota bacterium]MCU0253258.1 bifunctional diaminohydroxyphosphoribosylaminopyrimidine deaminase/5-amino-6-(5-phosphoribosylamino)uracil reductase RibD [Acidobacteriota bacterium]
MSAGGDAWLARALELAARGGRATAPNPRVGAVVVRDGAVVGEGWHRACGGPHAEAFALDAAGERARGATLYSSLEPCPHEGRQPPCVSRILRAGVARVVVGLVDPDPQVAGEGIAALRRAGVEVELATGPAAEAAEKLIEDYLVHRRQGRAAAALKIAATLDGCIADRHGTSRWVTGESARTAGRALRSRYGAILVGAGTVLADDPELRLPDDDDGGPFRRVLVDGRLSVPPEARLVAAGHAKAPVLVYSSPDADPARRAALERGGAEVVPLGPPGGPVPPGELLRDLARRGVLGVLVEGGGVTHGHFLAAGLADRIHWFVAPRLLADPAAIPAVAGPARPLDRAWEGAFAEVTRLGEDLLLTLTPRGA